MFKNVTLLLIMILTGLVTTRSTMAADMEMMHAAGDRAGIEALMWRYVRALDTFNSEAYAATFTEDGQFIAGENTVQGHEALKKMIDNYRRDREDRAARGEKVPPLNHVMTNEYLEFIDKDHARLHSYWMTIFGATGPDSPPQVAASGRGIDELVRVNGKWLIKLRNVTPD